jgi:hypothetical protein
MTDQSLIDQEFVPGGGRDVSAESADTCVRGVYGRCRQGRFGFARRLRLADEDASDAAGETMCRTPGG